MAEEEQKKVSEPPPAPAPAPAPEPASAEIPAQPAEETPKDVADLIPKPSPAEEKKHYDSKALAIIEKVPESTAEKTPHGSVDRDAVLAKVATEKRLALVKAWEESEKTKAENKAQKKLSAITAWENSMKAAVEADLKKIEEHLEKKKAEYVEKMKNKIAVIHREAEEKRAIIEARKGEDVLKAEETAAKCRATGTAPKKPVGCF